MCKEKLKESLKGDLTIEVIQNLLDTISEEVFPDEIHRGMRPSTVQTGLADVFDI